MRYILFVFSIICLLSCTRNTIVIQNPEQGESDARTSKIQLIHAAPGTAGIKLWQNNATELSVGRYYKSFTQYFPIQSGSTQFDLKRSSTNMLLNSFPAVIKEGSLYSLFICDSPSRLTPVLIYDNPLPTKSDLAQIIQIATHVSKEPFAMYFSSIKKDTLLISAEGEYNLSEPILPRYLARKAVNLLKKGELKTSEGNHHTMLYGEFAVEIVNWINQFLS